MTKTLSVFECQSCGYSSAKWLGRCPECSSWNSFVEEKRLPVSKTSPTARAWAQPLRLNEISADDSPRIKTGDSEFDRVLGGGVVPGSLVLLGGEPGVGKSTLLLQIARNLQQKGRRVLYVSGEESAQQIKMRADRLGQTKEDLFVLAEASLERIFVALEQVQPTDLIIDSIQTTYAERLDSPPGSISQVRHVTTELLNLAKTRQIPIFLIGHVTKDGSLAGPKALEHIVDTVLYFEGERRHNHRVVRAIKNRFGAANELGVFEMTQQGLLPVQNPSGIFMPEYQSPTAGSAVVCLVEGTRPLLVEVQALVIAAEYSTARRMSTGVDYNRISVLVAMLEKRLGFHLIGCDIYVNAAGGLQVNEPAADLGIVAAILSSFRNRPLSGQPLLLGELGLSGEVRPVSQVHSRIREAAALGLQRCVLPAGNLPLVTPVEGVQLLPLTSVTELSELIFDR